MSQLKKNIMILFKGFCMGVADVIPGVSGGTIAFLMGIYEELVEAVSSFDVQFVRAVLKGRLRQALDQTGWKFLTVLFTGILIAVFSLSHLLKWLMSDYPVYVYSFFFGLILTTVFIIAQKIQKGDFAKIAVGMMSAVLMFRLVGMMPIQTPETWWFVFLSGAIAICAWILPGISGAFILLLLGKYEYVITAVSDRNFSVLIIFALGCGIGLLSFIWILRWLLHRHYDLTLSVLAGIVLGSLRKIWPWKETISTMVTAKGKIVPIQQINVFPEMMTVETIVAVLLFISGICLGLWLSSFDQKRERLSA